MPSTRGSVIRVYYPFGVLLLIAVIPGLTPGACAVFPASALMAANSFSALPLSLAAAAAAAAVCLLFLACAAAAICRSRTVEASDRESSGTTFLAGGIVAIVCLPVWESRYGLAGRGSSEWSTQRWA